MPYNLFLLLIVVIAIIFIIRHKSKNDAAAFVSKTQENITRQKNGIYKNATILSVDGGMAGEQSGKARMTLTLHLPTADGKSYVAQTAWLVDITALDYLKPGKELQVKIDQGDPKIIYPSASWARYIPKNK